MTAIANDRPVAAGPTPRRADRTPEPEQRSRFEDALSRRDAKQEAKQPPDERPAPDPAQIGHTARHGFDLMQGGSHHGRGRRDQELAMLDGLRPAPATTATVPVEAPAPPAGAPTLAPTHAEFAARLELPTHVVGSEFQVSMSDTRWLASQAVVARGSDGGLSLDVATQGDGDAERQRAELRARLEARGHRIDRIDFDD